MPVIASVTGTSCQRRPPEKSARCPGGRPVRDSDRRPLQDWRQIVTHCTRSSGRSRPPARSRMRSRFARSGCRSSRRWTRDPTMRAFDRTAPGAASEASRRQSHARPRLARCATPSGRAAGNPEGGHRLAFRSRRAPAATSSGTGHTRNRWTEPSGTAHRPLLLGPVPARSTRGSSPASGKRAREQIAKVRRQDVAQPEPARDEDAILRRRRREIQPVARARHRDIQQAFWLPRARAPPHPRRPPIESRRSTRPARRPPATRTGSARASRRRPCRDSR